MKLKCREWVVAVAEKRCLDIRALDFHIIPNGIAKWVADPFPFEHGGILYIFGEVFEYSTGRGALGYTKLENGKFSPWKVVIREAYHMSFPNIFEKDRDIYICPETSACKQLYLYKAKSFPDIWEKSNVIKNNCNFNDTIFYQKDDDIYGFTSEWESLDKHSLRLFKLKDNSVEISNGKIDTLQYYMTRPGGKIIYDNGKEYFVSQICQPRYGAGLVIKEFNMDWPNYKEKEIYRVYPEDIKTNREEVYIGVHTLNYSENYVVIDLVCERVSLERLFLKVRNKLMN